MNKKFVSRNEVISNRGGFFRNEGSEKEQSFLWEVGNLCFTTNCMVVDRSGVSCTLELELLLLLSHFSPVWPTRLPRPWDSPDKNIGVGCHFLLQCMKVKSESEVAQPCPTLNDPMDCSLPGSSVHGIFQARVLEWGAIAFSSELEDVLPKLRYEATEKNKKPQDGGFYRQNRNNLASLCTSQSRKNIKEYFAKSGPSLWSTILMY